MKTKNLQRIIIGIILLLGFGNHCFATQTVVRNYYGNLAEVQRIRFATPDCREIYGEVAAVSDREITVKNQNQTRQYRFSERVQFYCNARACLRRALFPVTPDAFFEAQLLLDARGEVVVVNGFYYGEECIIKSWSKTDSLTITLEAASTGARFTMKVSDKAALPSVADWLQEDQLVFVLYGMNNQIRRIYLP
jgi:hypothetical protein